MDRKTIYAGQVPLETDLLGAQQDAMVALAEFCSTVLGTPTLVDAFTCTPTVPATLAVVLTPGNVYQVEDLEATTWSSLPANTSNTIMKQGILLNAVTIGVTPPTTFGFSQDFLLEVAYQDLDTGALVLPYYNAANPQSPFSGPGNAGSAQNTIRQGAVAYQIKAGTAASTGTQVAPSADPGFAGLFLITVANGQTTITSGNITTLTTAPFLATLGHLPQIPNGVQNWQWSYCADTGTTNAWIGTVAPIPLGLVPGLSVRVKVAHTITGTTTFNLNSLGAVQVNRANGSAAQSGDVNAGMVVDLVYDGTAWQIANFEGFTSSTVNNNTFTLSIPYCVDSGTTNHVVAPFSPTITSVSAGNIIEVKIAHTNTSASTITINALSSAPIVDLFGNALAAGTIQSGEVALMIYNGTSWQLVNVVKSGSVNIQVITASGNYTPTSGTTNALAFATGGGASGAIVCGGGSGGGAGSTAIVLVPTSGVSSISCTIGAGGSAVSASTGTNGNNGGTTTFGAFASAGGGVGGQIVSGNSSSGGSGGTATVGTMQIAGGDGNSGGPSQGDPNANGGGSFWGGGGAGLYQNSTTGNSGRAYGSGGGGANDTGGTATSGAGAPGVILILEF